MGKVQVSISLTKELDDILEVLMKELDLTKAFLIESRLRMLPEVQAKLRLAQPHTPYRV